MAFLAVLEPLRGVLALVVLFGGGPGVGELGARWCGGVGLDEVLVEHGHVLVPLRAVILFLVCAGRHGLVLTGAVVQLRHHGGLVGGVLPVGGLFGGGCLGGSRGLTRVLVVGVVVVLPTGAVVGGLFLRGRFRGRW